MENKMLAIGATHRYATALHIWFIDIDDVLATATEGDTLGANETLYL